MAKQIIWAPEAVADRIQILDYWQKKLGSRDYSIKLNNRFKKTVELISHFSEMGRKLENRDIRVFVVDDYQIFYLHQKKAVQTVHLWDSRRNPEDLNF